MNYKSVEEAFKNNWPRKLSELQDCVTASGGKMNISAFLKFPWKLEEKLLLLCILGKMPNLFQSV
jgi:hypothetical protein